MARHPVRLISCAVAALLAIAVVLSATRGMPQRLGAPAIRSASLIRSRPSTFCGGRGATLGRPDFRANVEPQSFADADYRKFGGSYDGYRSILKETKGMYGDELKPFLEEGYSMIDVRPVYEHERINTPAATHVPFIIEVTEGGLSSFARKWSNTVYAGHSRDLTRNTNFVADVQKEFPADAKIILTCGEGLRSLVAGKNLRDAGYTNILWLAGGFAGVPEGVLENAGTDVEIGYRRAGLDGGQLAGKIFDGVTSFKWWEMGGDKK
ncbi:hypothetical protein AAMO2058_000608100 [Amorphochlora amoebiformis]|eukprot:1352881-Amorphochlora_amoeboformis.AAC.1